LATFSVHFDGPITVDHKVPIRVLANTYLHMQRALDRSFLIQAHGEVWKGARLKTEEYAETAFIAEYPREGGIILDAVLETGGEIVEGIATAVKTFFDASQDEGITRFESMSDQLASRRTYVQQMNFNTPNFQDVANDPPHSWATNYSNKSVVKEVNQLVSQITPERLDGSTVEITLHGTRAHLPFQFDRAAALRFHNVTTRRELGAAFKVLVRIRSLDRGNSHAKPSAKVRNLFTDREVTLHIPTMADCEALHPFHNGQEVLLFVSPVIEALGFDLFGGDLQFLAVANG
jgi:hypothetical protein